MADEPLTTDQVKARLGITSAHRDAEIAQLISAARFHVEDYTGLILTRRTVTEVLDHFGAEIRLASWPVIELETITYLDPDEAPQEVAGARVRLGSRPARVFAPLNGAWPLTASPGEIALQVLAGFDHTLAAGEPGAIPAPLITAMLLLIAHWFENKEAVLVGTIATDLPHGWMSLCRPYRVGGFF